jgi:hypothetical protein
MALALAAPNAGAQYPPAAPPAYETQVPDPSADTTDPMAPEATPQAETAPDPAAPPPADTMTPSDPATAEAQISPDPYDQTAPDAYAQTTPAAGPSIDLTDEAVMAGMDSVPMTAAEVCEPRSVSLTQSGSRLNRDARRHLINAADHASVCEMQRIVVRSPNGRADAAVATLADLGVDRNLIEVEQAADGGLGLEMQFAGVATSSEEYAAMFNPVQTASLSPGETPVAPSEPAPDMSLPAEPAPETDMSQPGSYEPAPTGYEPTAPEPTSYEPSAEETTPSPIY